LSMPDAHLIPPIVYCQVGQVFGMATVDTRHRRGD
jgi:hypothetical protein